MAACENCGGFVTEQYVRVFAPTGMDDVRVCPNCEDKLRDGAEVREAHSPRHTNNGWINYHRAAGNVGNTGTPDTNTDASIAQFDCPAENFALYDLFERVPDARIELDQTVATADDHTLLVVRTNGREHTVEDALRSSPHVTSTERFAEQPDGWMYRVRWSDCPRQFIQGLTNVNVTLLSARGRDGRWTFRLLAPDREGIASAHDIMDDLGCRAECRRITTYDGDESECSPLTDGQREALISAVEAGYYEIPREVTADELADDIGISHQALSERFRRAYRQLIESALVASSDSHVDRTKSY